MIRLLLMALGAYTLYRIYAPLETDGRPRELLSDLRAKSPSERRPTSAAGGARS